MLGTFLANPVGSWLRVFITAALTLWLADLTEGSGWVFDWAAYALAGLVSVLPVIVAWLNPQDARFGRVA